MLLSNDDTAAQRGQGRVRSGAGFKASRGVEKMTGIMKGTAQNGIEQQVRVITQITGRQDISSELGARCGCPGQEFPLGENQTTLTGGEVPKPQSPLPQGLCHATHTPHIIPITLPRKRFLFPGTNPQTH